MIKLRLLSLSNSNQYNTLNKILGDWCMNLTMPYVLFNIFYYRKRGERDQKLMIGIIISENLTIMDGPYEHRHHFFLILVNIIDEYYIITLSIKSVLRILWSLFVMAKI